MRMGLAKKEKSLLFFNKTLKLFLFTKSNIDVVVVSCVT